MQIDNMAYQGQTAFVWSLEIPGSLTFIPYCTYPTLPCSLTIMSFNVFSFLWVVRVRMVAFIYLSDLFLGKKQDYEFLKAEDC